MRNRTICLLFIVLWLLQAPCVHAQEENNLAVQSNRYIGLKVKSLEKLNARLERQQKSLLKKLTRGEQRFAAKLKQQDSAAYERYSHQRLSYDSIQKLANPDSAMLAKTAARR